MNYLNFRFLAFTVMIGFLILGGCASATQKITVSDVTIDTVGSTQTAALMIDQAPKGVSGYTITLTISDPQKAVIKTWIAPSWADMKSNGDLPGSEVQVQAAALTADKVPVGSTGIPLGTMVIEGLSAGTTTVHVQLRYLDDNTGGNYIPSTEVIDGVITVNAKQGTVISPLRVPGLTNLPTDPDHDGLYEDLNGDGTITFTDVSTFFYNIHWIENNEPVTLFDYDQNRMIDFGDILVLNQKI
jgi:PKD repeat protein